MSEPQDFSEALFFFKSWYARDLEELAKEIRSFMGPYWIDGRDDALNAVAAAIENRANRINAQLCSQADRDAVEAEKNLPTSWSRLTP